MTLSQDAVAGLVKEAERAKAYAGWFAEQYMAVPAADMMMFATALEQQAARIAELEAALLSYGTHFPGCASNVYLTSMPTKQQKCTCGLDAARSRHAKGGEAKEPT